MANCSAFAVQPQSQAPQAAQTAPICDGVRRQLDVRLLDLDRNVGQVVALVISLVCVAGGVVCAFLTPLWVAVLAGTGLLAVSAFFWWLAVAWPPIEHRHLFYAIDPDQLRLWRGVWWKSEIHVARSRIQHTDVTQGPFERRYKLGTLVVYTAGREYSKVELRGLDFEHAQAIRAFLSPRQASDGV